MFLGLTYVYHHVLTYIRQMTRPIYLFDISAALTFQSICELKCLSQAHLSLRGSNQKPFANIRALGEPAWLLQGHFATQLQGR